MKEKYKDDEKLKVGPVVDKCMVVDDALQVLSKAGTNSAIVTEYDKPVGSVVLDKLIAAVARPKVGENLKFAVKSTGKFKFSLKI